MVVITNMLFLFSTVGEIVGESNRRADSLGAGSRDL